MKIAKKLIPTQIPTQTFEFKFRMKGLKLNLFSISSSYFIRSSWRGGPGWSVCRYGNYRNWRRNVLSEWRSYNYDVTRWRFKNTVTEWRSKINDVTTKCIIEWQKFVKLFYSWLRLVLKHHIYFNTFFENVIKTFVSTLINWYSISLSHWMLNLFNIWNTWQYLVAYPVFIKAQKLLSLSNLILQNADIGFYIQTNANIL